MQSSLDAQPPAAHRRRHAAQRALKENVQLRPRVLSPRGPNKPSRATGTRSRRSRRCCRNGCSTRSSRHSVTTAKRPGAAARAHAHAGMVQMHCLYDRRGRAHRKHYRIAPNVRQLCTAQGLAVIQLFRVQPLPPEVRFEPIPAWLWWQPLMPGALASRTQSALVPRAGGRPEVALGDAEARDRG